MPEPAKNITIVHSKNAKLSDTLFHLKRIIKEYSYQIKDIADELKAPTIEETCSNIWNWTRENIQYKKDETNIEQLRRPARIIVDGFGDCDCMTILICSLLREIGIENASKTTAYPQKDKNGNYKKDFSGNYISDDYSHIYAIAYNEKGKQIVIDTVPEIPYFKFEYQPITKFIITKNMQLHELGELGEDDDSILSDIVGNDEINGTEEEFEQIYETTILENIVISDVPTKNAISKSELITRSIIADISKQKQILIADKTANGHISSGLNIDVEINVFEQVLAATDLQTVLRQAAKSKSFFAEYFGAMLENFESALDGIEDNEEIVFLSQLDETDQAEIGRLKLKLKKPKIFGKDGILKKGLDVVKKFSPVMLAFRAAALVIIRANFLRISEKLAIGYMTEEQAKAKKYNIDSWKQFVAARQKFEKKWTNLGGKESALKKAVVEGRAGKKAGLKGDLGAIGLTAALVTAAPIVVAIKEIFGKLNIKSADPNDSGDEESENGDAQENIETKNENMDNKKLPGKLPVNPNKEVAKTADEEETQFATTSQKRGFIQTIKSSVSTHKKWWIIGGGGLLVGIIIFFVWLMKKKKPAVKRRRRPLNGTPKATPNRKKRVLKTTTIQKRQLSGLSGAAKKRTTKTSHLKQLHAKARKLKIAHPKMKYSTALKKANSK